MDQLLKMLRAAAEPSRLRLLRLCADGEFAVNELVRILGQSQPGVSRHLKVLCDAELLDRQTDGTWAFYRVSRTAEAASVVDHLLALLPTEDATLQQDLDRLGEIKEDRRHVAQAYFETVAREWDAIRTLYVAEEEIERALVACLADRELGALLDIGTGTGRLLRLLGSRADRGEGIDTSRRMLEVAQANLEAAGLENCEVRHADMYRLPFEDGAFDTLTVHQVLHFADAPAAVVSEAARVLRPGGRFAIVDFAPHEREELRKKFRHRRLGFADEVITAWFAEAGLETRTTEHLGGGELTVGLWLAEKPVTGRNR